MYNKWNYKMSWVGEKRPLNECLNIWNKKACSFWLNRLQSKNQLILGRVHWSERQSIIPATMNFCEVTFFQYSLTLILGGECWSTPSRKSLNWFDRFPYVFWAHFVSDPHATQTSICLFSLPDAAIFRLIRKLILYACCYDGLKCRYLFKRSDFLWSL